MSTPDPISAKQAVGRLAGPRYRPAAHNIIALADAAVKAHAAIGAVIAGHAATVAEAHAAKRAAGGADSHAAPPPGAGAP